MLEDRRLRALERYTILDTQSEPSFDRIAQLTALVLNAPIAVIGFLDGSRHWFKAAFGTDQRENSRAESFCTHTIEQTGILEVTDALHSSFAALPVVRDAGIRAYAGTPLSTSGGERIGTLCVFDTRVRSPLEPIERALLLELAALTMRLLEARREGFSAGEPSVTDLTNLEWRALYGRGDDAPPPPAVSGAAPGESRLLERVRAVAPAPMIGGAARLPRDRVLVTHTFGAAPDGAVWQIWGLGKTSAPRALESFAGDMTAFDLPEDAALLLLSLERLGDAPSAPTRVLASAQIG